MKLEVQNLTLARDGHQILSDVSFSVNSGECVVLRGKNGAGKSSLLAAIMGLEGVSVTSGDILVDGQSILSQETHDRARSGIFLAHQEPPAIDGISLAFMARTAMGAMCGITDVPIMQQRIRDAEALLQLPEGFVHKMLNAEMSGGEKKRAEMLQLLVTQPKLALLDEIDSGVDAATRNLFLHIISQLRSTGTTFVVVTHSEEFGRALQKAETVTF